MAARHQCSNLVQRTSGRYCDRLSKVYDELRGEGLLGADMQTNGLTVEAADGLHEDGWCWPETRLTLVANQDASEFRAVVWFKPEDQGAQRALMTVGTDKSSPVVEFVDLGEPKEFVLPMIWRQGEVMSVRIATPHKMSRSAEEQRNITFSLVSLSAV